MKAIYLLVLLFAALGGSVQSNSARIHIVEKFYFYFNYKIEGIVGGERTFAPNCENCDFKKVYFDFSNLTRRRANAPEVC